MYTAGKEPTVSRINSTRTRNSKLRVTGGSCSISTLVGNLLADSSCCLCRTQHWMAGVLPPKRNLGLQSLERDMLAIRLEVVLLVAHT